MRVKTVIEYGVASSPGGWVPCVWVDGKSVSVPYAEPWLIEQTALIVAEGIAAREGSGRPGTTVKERRR